MDVVLVLSVRNFPSLELPPERHDMRALTREAVHAVRQPAFLYDVTAELEDVRDEAAALLEVLSGERLPMERGRVLRRPHYLSNINTALEFLRGKRVSE